MNTTNEFRASVEAILGRPLEDDTALVETAFGSLRVTLKPDAPAILLRFSTPGEPWEAEAPRAGINPQSGGWDILTRENPEGLEDNRKLCVRTLQRRLALVGYVPPVSAAAPQFSIEEAVAAFNEGRKVSYTLHGITYALEHLPEVEAHGHPGDPAEWFFRRPRGPRLFKSYRGPEDCILHALNAGDRQLVIEGLEAPGPLDGPMDLTRPADALLAAVRGTGLAEPVAWSYELAKSRWPDGTYDGPWEARLTAYPPNVPMGSMRNLTPLFPGVVDFSSGSAIPRPAGLPALALTPEEKRLLTELLTNAVEIPVAYPAGGHMAAIVGKTQDTFRGLLEKLQNL